MTPPLFHASGKLLLAGKPIKKRVTSPGPGPLSQKHRATADEEEAEEEGEEEDEEEEAAEEEGAVAEEENAVSDEEDEGGLCEQRQNAKARGTRGIHQHDHRYIVHDAYQYIPIRYNTH